MTVEIENVRRSKTGRVISIAIVVTAVILCLTVIYQTNRYPRTDDATVIANLIGVAPQVNGPIVKLYVKDNQSVHTGDLLFEIDAKPYEYALQHALAEQETLEKQIVDMQRTISAQQSGVQSAAAHISSSEANVNSSNATVRSARASVASAQSGEARAKADFAYAESNLRRLEPLLAKQYVTADQVDQARTLSATRGEAVRQAHAQLVAAQAQLESAQAQTAQSRAVLQQSGAELQQSIHSVTTLDPLLAQREVRAAAVRTAQYDLDNCRVRAPFDARVTGLTISEGAYAHVGQQVFTLIDTRTWWVVGNFRETQLLTILPGMKADVYVMSQPTIRYVGIVESIGYGVMPEEDVGGQGLPNAQGPSGGQGLPNVQRSLNWVHLATRFPVRIRIQNPQPNAFRIGTSAVISVRGWHGQDAR